MVKADIIIVGLQCGKRGLAIPQEVRLLEKIALPCRAVAGRVSAPGRSGRARNLSRPLRMSRPPGLGGSWVKEEAQSHLSK